jgi:hypothetical protein
MTLDQKNHVSTPTKPFDNKFVTFLLSYTTELDHTHTMFGDGDFSAEMVSKKTSVSYELKIPYEKLASEFEKDTGRPPINGENFVEYLREFKYDTLKHLVKFTDEFYLIQLPDEKDFAEDMEHKKELHQRFLEGR